MPVKQVLEARPDMVLVAEYPSEGRSDIFPIELFGVLSFISADGGFFFFLLLF